MSWDWADYLGLAKDLAKQANRPELQEAKHRSAVSRAYYAAFQKAYDRLIRTDGQTMPKGDNKHQWVILTFQASSNVTRREIGTHLDRLRTERNAADYDRTIPQPALQCAYGLMLADQIMASLALL